MKNACPTEETLADFIEGRLPTDERAKMEVHLSDCDFCLEEFRVGNRILRGKESVDLDPVPTRVTEHAVHSVSHRPAPYTAPLLEKLKRSARGITSSLSGFFGPLPWGRLAPAPVRGPKTVVADDLVHLRKTFKGVETEIEIEKIGKNKAHIRVKLVRRHGRRKKIRVTLKRGAREVSSQPLNGGYVLFEEVPFGHYGLSLSRDGVELGTYLFEIKESHHGRK